MPYLVKAMSPNLDILYTYRTQLQVKKMLTPILTLTVSAWISFAAYLSWYIAAAKTSIPISMKEAKTLWHIHKQNSTCKAHKWEPLSQKGEIVKGFKCQCGYKYTQKKPLFALTSAKTQINNC